MGVLSLTGNYMANMATILFDQKYNGVYLIKILTDFNLFVANTAFDYIQINLVKYGHKNS